jgi:hypothetical protein
VYIIQDNSGFVNSRIDYTDQYWTNIGSKRGNSEAILVHYSGVLGSIKVEKGGKMLDFIVEFWRERWG